MSLPSKCSLCKSKINNLNVVTAHVYKKKNHAFFKCNKCQVIFQYPLVSEKDETNFYKTDFEKFMEGRSGLEIGWTDANKHFHSNYKNYLRRYKFLKKYLNKKKLNILEIGCSSGFMLDPLIKKGHNCTGIEPSGYFSKFLKKKNIIIFDDIKKIKNQKFDLIMHFFVLEHIRSPLTFLKEQMKLLKKNGKIIFEIPNYHDALYSIYDIPEFERFYWSEVHPWYFNKSSINFLLKKISNNFSVSYEQRYDLSNHLYWSQFRKPGGQNFFSSKLGIKLENFYKKELIKRGFADTLICSVRK
jgi:SAM-dependent methyltransferase